MAPQTRSGNRSRQPASQGSKVSKAKNPKTQTTPQDQNQQPAEPGVDCVFFWRPEDPDVGFLSQWYPSPFSDPSDPDVVFPTAEHFMMYHKALLFDPASGPGILAAESPNYVRSLGRLIPNYDEDTWVANRERVVRRGNLLKFTRGAESERLAALLLATAGRHIVEASPFDRVWGIGIGPAKAATSNRKRWGRNLLGKALMEVRDELVASAGQRKEEETH